MNKNFIIAGAVILVLGLAIAIGVTLSSEPVAAGLPEGETTIIGDLLPEFAGENDDNIALGLAAPIFSAPNENSEIVNLEKMVMQKLYYSLLTGVDIVKQKFL